MEGIQAAKFFFSFWEFKLMMIKMTNGSGGGCKKCNSNSNNLAACKAYHQLLQLITQFSAS